METLWIVIMGAIQGATEFLPVSSSGHLAVSQLILAEHGEQLSDRPFVLEIVLHLATLLAVIIFYRRHVAAAVVGAGRGIRALFQGRLGNVLADDDGATMAMAVVVGTVPTGIIGILVKGVAGHVSRSATGLGLTFLCCAGLLLASRWCAFKQRKLDWKVALIIGTIQGLAVLPGISRSGATIACALALGMDREAAARFSFLLSIPAIAGAALVELDLSRIDDGGHALAFALGGLVAFVIGLAALTLLVRVVKQGRLWLFAPYVAAVGILTLAAL